jgi:hypothetical protein
LRGPPIHLLFMEIPVTHTISFRRPELPYVLSTMSVPPGADPEEHVRHLVDLGYNIVTVSPPLGGYGPPQNPQPRMPELTVICEAESSVENGAE